MAGHRRGGPRRDLGPTAWNAVHRLPPRRSLALAVALLFVLVLLKIGDDANYEFIYFQF